MNATETAPKKTKRKQDTCYCDAYRFPHRLGGGKCENVDIDGPFCTSCGSSCEVVQGDDGIGPYMVRGVLLKEMMAFVVQGDDGIGPYEFWGQKGNDSQPYSASDCCDAEVVEHQHELDMVEVWG